MNFEMMFNDIIEQLKCINLHLISINRKLEDGRKFSDKEDNKIAKSNKKKRK